MAQSFCGRQTKEQKYLTSQKFCLERTSRLLLTVKKKGLQAKEMEGQSGN
jgi:hypothetical protein